MLSCDRDDRGPEHRGSQPANPRNEMRFRQMKSGHGLSSRTRLRSPKFPPYVIPALADLNVRLGLAETALRPTEHLDVCEPR